MLFDNQIIFENHDFALPKGCREEDRLGDMWHELKTALQNELQDPWVTIGKEYDGGYEQALTKKLGMVSRYIDEYENKLDMPRRQMNGDQRTLFDELMEEFDAEKSGIYYLVDERLNMLWQTCDINMKNHDGPSREEYRAGKQLVEAVTAYQDNDQYNHEDFLETMSELNEFFTAEKLQEILKMDREAMQVYDQLMDSVKEYGSKSAEKEETITPPPNKKLELHIVHKSQEPQIS